MSRRAGHDLGVRPVEVEDDHGPAVGEHAGARADLVDLAAGAHLPQQVDRLTRCEWLATFAHIWVDVDARPSVSAPNDFLTGRYLGTGAADAATNPPFARFRGGRTGNRVGVEGRSPVVPSPEEEHPRGVAAERGVPVWSERPRRRRRSALLGGAILVAVSPVAVGAGLFVPGYAALGLGALLLLLPPPRGSSRRRHRSSLRVVGTSAAAAGRGIVAVARAGGRAGARTLGAVQHFAAHQGRDGAAAAGRVVRATGSRAWATLLVVTPLVWRGLVVAARSVARETQSTSIRVWKRTRPVLRRAWAAVVAGSVRAAHELARFARWASERLSAFVDSRTASGQRGSRAPRAPGPPPETPAEPTRRTPAPHPGARVRSGRSPRSPRSSR